MCASNGITFDNDCLLAEAKCTESKENPRSGDKNGDEDSENGEMLFKLFDGNCPPNPSFRGKHILLQWYKCLITVLHLSPII